MGVYLHWTDRRALFATVEEAQAQAEHDASLGIEIVGIFEQEADAIPDNPEPYQLLETATELPQSEEVRTVAVEDRPAVPEENANG